MDANERIINRLERLYSLYGAGDRVDAVVSVGGHAYRQDIRQAAYRFINAHLKGDARPITDSEIDIVSEGSHPGPYPIPPEKLRVFPTDADLPADQLNTKIDEHFVPLAEPAPPTSGEFDAWKKSLADRAAAGELRLLSRDDRGGRKLGDADGARSDLQSEEGIEFRLRHPQPMGKHDCLLVVLNEDEAGHDA